MTFKGLTSHWLLGNHIGLFLILGIVVNGNAEYNTCEVSNGEEIKFLPCQTDCSQDEGKFNCSIGVLEDLENFLRKVKHGTILDPPNLLDIKYKYCEAQACIDIIFKLPTAKYNIYPEAVQLHFQGITEKDFYTSCPRQRIFRFHSYPPKYNQDGVFPRNISYSCFYGVDDQTNYLDFKRGYHLGLKSIPGKWRNYTITLNAAALVLPLYKWVPTIAVSLDVANRSLFVLVERPRAEFKVYYINVNLRRSNMETALSKTLDGQKHLDVTFTGLLHGKYFVKVIIYGGYNNQQSNWTGETVEIDATAIEAQENTLHYADYNVGPLKIFSMVGGCLIGLVLLVILGTTVYRKKPCTKRVYEEKLTGFILHPYDNVSDSDHVEFVEQYGKLLEKKCNCSLLSWKLIQTKSAAEAKKWLESDFQSLSFIIVFFRNDFYEVKTNHYSLVLKEAEKLNRLHLLHIIPIELKGSPSLPLVIRNISAMKWDDLDSISCKMTGTASCREVKSWKNTRAGKSLHKLFQRLPMEDVLSERNNIQIQNTIEDVPQDHMSKAKPEVLDTKTMECFLDFAKILNEENDSVIGGPYRPYCKRENSIQSVQADVHFDSLVERSDPEQPLLGSQPIGQNPVDHNLNIMDNTPSDEKKSLFVSNGKPRPHLDMNENKDIPLLHEHLPNKPHENMEPSSTRRDQFAIPIPSPNTGPIMNRHMNDHAYRNVKDSSHYCGDEQIRGYTPRPLHRHVNLPEQYPIHCGYPPRNEENCHKEYHVPQPQHPNMSYEKVMHNYSHSNQKYHGNPNNNYYHGNNFDQGKFHNQHHNVNMPADPNKYFNPLLGANHRNQLAVEEFPNQLYEARGHLPPGHQLYYHESNPPHERILMYDPRDPPSHRQRPETEFGAFDPSPGEARLRSKPNQGHVKRESHYNEYERSKSTMEECEMDDLKSVSQNDLDRLNIERFNVMESPDRSSEESITTEGLEDQLKKINNSSGNWS